MYLAARSRHFSTHVGCECDFPFPSNYYHISFSSSLVLLLSSRFIVFHFRKTFNWNFPNNRAKPTRPKMMNNLLKSTVRLTALKSLLAPVPRSMGPGRRDFTRTLWHMSKGAESANTILLHQPSMSCQCGCGSINQVHTKGTPLFMVKSFY